MPGLYVAMIIYPNYICHLDIKHVYPFLVSPNEGQEGKEKGRMRRRKEGRDGGRLVSFIPYSYFFKQILGFLIYFYKYFSMYMQTETLKSYNSNIIIKIIPKYPFILLLVLHFFFNSCL
jgi:hypothetical protein